MTNNKMVMFDTNIFNRILDENIQLGAHIQVYATHVQRDELSRSSEPRKSELLLVFSEVNPTILATETSIWGDSDWGQKWSSDDGVYEGLLHRILELDRVSGKQHRVENQSRDARIAETALKSKITLITNDKNLAQAASEFGCDTARLEELISAVRQ